MNLKLNAQLLLIKLQKANLKDLNWKSKSTILIVLTIAVIGTTIGWAIIFLNSKKELVVNHKLERPRKEDNGRRIIFPKNYPGLARITVKDFNTESGFITLQAPGRIVATTSSSQSNGQRIILFESSEISTLYSEYLHSRNQFIRSEQNMIRVKRMFENQVATLKDTIETETEALNTKAELASNEAKLRALGFNPMELSQTKNRNAWVICDVPESSLEMIQKGKKVNILFSALPHDDIYGIAEAIGDNVDPDTRTVKVRIRIQNPSDQLKPGMYAKIEFGEKISGFPVVPLSAVFTMEGKPNVFVQVNPEVFERREVVLGTASPEKVTILEGLTTSEKVVIQGTILLKGISVGY